MVLASTDCAVLEALAAAVDPADRTAATVAQRLGEHPRTVQRTLRALAALSPPLVEPDADADVEVVAWRVTERGRSAHAAQCR